MALEVKDCVVSEQDKRPFEQVDGDSAKLELKRARGKPDDEEAGQKAGARIVDTRYASSLLYPLLLHPFPCGQAGHGASGGSSSSSSTSDSSSSGGSSSSSSNSSSSSSDSSNSSEAGDAAEGAAEAAQEVVEQVAEEVTAEEPDEVESLQKKPRAKAKRAASKAATKKVEVAQKKGRSRPGGREESEGAAGRGEAQVHELALTPPQRGSQLAVHGGEEDAEGDSQGGSMRGCSSFL